MIFNNRALKLRELLNAPKLHHLWSYRIKGKTSVFFNRELRGLSWEELQGIIQNPYLQTGMTKGDLQTIWRLTFCSKQLRKFREELFS